MRSTAPAWARSSPSTGASWSGRWRASAPAWTRRAASRHERNDEDATLSLSCGSSGQRWLGLDEARELLEGRCLGDERPEGGRSAAGLAARGGAEKDRHADARGLEQPRRERDAVVAT